MDSDEFITVMTSSLSFASTSTSSPSPLPSPAPESPPPHPLPLLVVRPCGACKGLRRRCVTTCLLAPYFPPTQPLKFLAVHRVFGACTVSKFLQGIPESRRADAVDSMVYEATIRIRDPVYGCAGVISNLQKLIKQLQMELATTKAQLLIITSQQENLPETSTCMEMKEADQLPTLQQPSLEDFMSCATPYSFQNCENFLWDNSFLPLDDTNNGGI
ncbi:LOB domain-containing protein 1-like [Macadamia integrifolia]|uniref:LOB domain-containing protein 1-like n=1 Tax=Macadamia integrifolia TaxID=60698 RepID=UPI001C4F45CF|nr:LOB domain-containing protein 1-like [Macadamia integrifolia]